MSTIDPRAVYETTWWEYVLDENGKTVSAPFVNGISSPMMRRIDDHSIVLPHSQLPAGALWVARRPVNRGRDEYPAVGNDGLAVYCKHVDGHPWHIDGRASNCTMPNDYRHRCWVRHGTVGENLTVDKNGNTCKAGAGSFFMGPNNEWHGFLRQGKLTP
jgi:hypothetical protein